MPKRGFPIDQVLYCAASALGRQGYCDDMPPDSLHLFLANDTPSFFARIDLERYCCVNVMCGLIILDQHPGLRAAVESTLPPLRGDRDAFENEHQFRTWLRSQEQEFGATLEVEQVSAGKLRQYRASARGIALRNIEAYGDLTANPEEWY